MYPRGQTQLPCWQKRNQNTYVFEITQAVLHVTSPLFGHLCTATITTCVRCVSEQVSCPPLHLLNLRAVSTNTGWWKAEHIHSRTWLQTQGCDIQTWKPFAHLMWLMWKCSRTFTFTPEPLHMCTTIRRFFLAANVFCFLIQHKASGNKPRYTNNSSYSVDLPAASCVLSAKEARL